MISKIKTNFIYCVPATRAEDNKKYYKIGLCFSKGGWERKRKRLKEYPYPDKMRFNKETVYRWYVENPEELRAIEKEFHDYLNRCIPNNTQPTNTGKEFFEAAKSKYHIDILAQLRDRKITLDNVRTFIQSTFY